MNAELTEVLVGLPEYFRDIPPEKIQSWWKAWLASQLASRQFEMILHARYAGVRFERVVGATFVDQMTKVIDDRECAVLGDEDANWGESDRLSNIPRVWTANGHRTTCDCWRCDSVKVPQ